MDIKTHRSLSQPQLGGAVNTVCVCVCFSESVCLLLTVQQLRDKDRQVDRQIPPNSSSLQFVISYFLSFPPAVQRGFRSSGAASERP